MTEQQTLTEFITARLDEDEAAALAAREDSSVDGEYLPWRLSGDIGTDLYAGHIYMAGGAYGGMDEGVAHHIVRHDPARVLREVAAKRVIVKDHLEDHSPEHDCAEHLKSLRSEHSGCYVIVQLVAIYSDHESYLPKWRP